MSARSQSFDDEPVFASRDPHAGKNGAEPLTQDVACAFERLPWQRSWIERCGSKDDPDTAALGRGAGAAGAAHVQADRNHANDNHQREAHPDTGYR